MAGQHQPPGRGVDEQAVGSAEVTGPVAILDLVVDEVVGGRRVGNAQQCLGEAHQDDAFFGRQAIFAEKGIDTAELPAAGACRVHQPARRLVDPSLFLDGLHRPPHQPGEHARLVGEVLAGDFVAWRQLVDDSAIAPCEQVLPSHSSARWAMNFASWVAIRHGWR